MPVWGKKKKKSRKEAKAGKVIRLGCKSDPPVKERRAGDLQDTQVQSLAQEDPLEEEMVTH